MIDDMIDVAERQRGATLGKLRHDLLRCIVRAEALGLTAIAIYLQRAVDEIDEIRS